MVDVNASNIKQVFLDILQEFQWDESFVYLPRQFHLPQVPGKALILVGCRRSGKTTLLRELWDQDSSGGATKLEDLIYCNFSDERLANLSSEHLGLLLEAHQELFPKRDSSGKTFLFLDEIQLVEGWELFVDRLLRSGRFEIVLTGSSAKLLSTDIATAMRGRSIPFEVYPFSFSEYLRFEKIAHENFSASNRGRIRAALKQYLKWGAFPEVVPLEEPLKRLVLQEYFNVLLLKDIIERYNFSQPLLAKMIFSTLVSLTASPLSVSKLHARLKSLGYKIDRTFLSEFLQWCEDCYAFFQVSLYTDSVSKKSINPKKLYCIDNGFLTLHSTQMNENRGRLLENAVFLELKRRGLQIYYYKTHGGFEVDFVIEKQAGVVELIQVCEEWGDLETQKREIRALLSAEKEFKRECELTLVTLDHEEMLNESGKQIRIVSAWKFLLGRA